MRQRGAGEWGPRHGQRARLLIEDPDPGLQVSEFRSFEEAGFDVALCSGPGEGDVCPLEEGGECRLAELADIILMGPGMAPHRAALAGEIHRRRPDLPVVVQIPRGRSDQCPPGCSALECPSSVGGQIRALERALD